jgi:hypothetical protein
MALVAKPRRHETVIRTFLSKDRRHETYESILLPFSHTSYVVRIKVSYFEVLEVLLNY